MGQVTEQNSRTKSAAFSIAAWLTVERGLYAVILAIAAFVRFFALAGPPLTTLEAINTWPAWLAAVNAQAPNAPMPTSALLYSIQTLFFWTTGGGDVVARLAPALAGVGLVGLAWWWRPWLGRPAALAAALLLAVDPWQTAMSRLADGAALSLFLGMLCLTGMLWLRDLPEGEPGRIGWLNFIAICAGLLLVSGTVAWSLVPVLVLFIALRQTSAIGLLPWPQGRPLSGEGEIATLSPTAMPVTPPRVNDLTLPIGHAPVALFVGAALLGATGWLARPEALGLVSHSLSVWLGQLWTVSGPSYAPAWPFLRLIMDEPLVLLLGLAGLIGLWTARVEFVRGEDEPITDTTNAPAATRDPQGWAWFLTAWILWGLLLILLPGRNPLHLPILGLPLLLVAAQTLARIVQSARRDAPWRESGILVAVLTVILIAFVFWLWALIFQAQFDTSLVRAVILFLLLAVMLVVLFALWADWRQARIVAGAYISCLLLLVTLSSLWQLNQRFAVGEPEGFFADYTDSDVRRLAENVHALSAQRTGDATQMPVLVQMRSGEPAGPDPVVGWYLRSLRNLSWVLAPSTVQTPEQRAPLVVTLADHIDDPQLAGYMGSRYWVHRMWTPSNLSNNEEVIQTVQNDGGFWGNLSNNWSTRVRPFLRWLLYRKAPNMPPGDAVILWVKSE